MPIFEFRCCGCGHVFETIRMRSDEQLELICPQCGGDTLERVVSVTNYVMGSGKSAKPKITSRACGSGNQCMTLELPGPSGR